MPIDKGWHLRTGFGDARRVNLGKGETGDAIAKIWPAHVQHDLAPWVDHQAVPIRCAAIFVGADLGCRDDIGRCLYRAGALQHMPMRRPCWHRKRGWDGNHVAFCPP